MSPDDAQPLQTAPVSSKLDLQLDPRQRSDAAVKEICRRLLATLEANEEGTRLGLDSEFLHQLRVAARRTRSLLGQVKSVVPRSTVASCHADLKWLGRVTGPARDLDVSLIKLPRYRDLMPAAVWQDLRPLRDFLRHQQRREQAALAAALGSERYRTLITSWHEFVNRPPEVDDEQAPDAARPIRQVAAERIWRAYRRVRKKGRRIGEKSPDQDLHDLRIACKKLRYLMEFFRSLFPARPISRLIKELKQLQDCLGDFNDVSVQQEQLLRCAEQMLEQEIAPAPTFLAMGRIVALLEQEQRHERLRCSKRFATFIRRTNRQRFADLFGSPPPG